VFAVRNIFKKMMREQIQEGLENLADLAQKPPPQGGWIQVIRKALGITTYQLAKKMGCSQSNIVASERREKAGNISLKSLSNAAQAMDCRLVYFFVPNKPLNQLLKEQAQKIARQRLKSIGHSMELEQQGLSPKQTLKEENDLVQELLKGNLSSLWEDDEI